MMEQRQDQRSRQADHHLTHETYPCSMGPMKNEFHKQILSLNVAYRAC